MGDGVGETLAVAAAPGVLVAAPPCAGAPAQAASSAMQRHARAAPRRRVRIEVPFWAGVICPIAAGAARRSCHLRGKHILFRRILQMDQNRRLKRPTRAKNQQGGNLWAEVAALLVFSRATVLV